MSMNRIAAAAAAVARLGVILCAVCIFPTASAHFPVPSEAEEAAASARQALARLPAEARLGDIKNEQLRRAVQATYRAIIELADNREPGRVGALNSRFERAYASVERETARGEHKSCAANCKALDGEPCLTKCKASRQKFCGCRLIVFGCVVAECVF